MTKTTILSFPDILDHVRTLDYQTPYFYTSKEALKANYEAFAHSFRSSEVYYALKANSDPKILDYLKHLGCGFEAASAYEIEMLLQVGVKPQRIIYGTSVKPSSHIIYARKAGIDRFAADSKEEVEKIATHAPGAKVFIRAIVDDTGSVFTMSERFGTPIGFVKNLLILAKNSGLEPYGISFYVGSQATHSDRWSKAIHMIQPVIKELFDNGIKLEMINIGGGFPVNYDNHPNAPQLKQIVTSVHDAMDTLPYEPSVIMEPGRGIVASSTVLVTEVIARNDRAGRPWLVLDAGIYNALYEAMIHQGATQYAVHPLHPPTGNVETMTCTLAGPTGDSLDIITRHAILPSYIGVGDKLVFENTGAYSVTMASPFNGFPKPELFMS